MAAQGLWMKEDVVTDNPAGARVLEELWVLARMSNASNEVALVATGPNRTQVEYRVNQRYLTSSWSGAFVLFPRVHSFLSEWLVLSVWECILQPSLFPSFPSFSLIPMYQLPNYRLCHRVFMIALVCNIDIMHAFAD